MNEERDSHVAELQKRHKNSYESPKDELKTQGAIENTTGRAENAHEGDEYCVSGGRKGRLIGNKTMDDLSNYPGLVREQGNFLIIFSSFLVLGAGIANSLPLTIYKDLLRISVV